VEKKSYETFMEIKKEMLSGDERKRLADFYKKIETDIAQMMDKYQSQLNSEDPQVKEETPANMTMISGLDRSAMQELLTSE